MPGLSNHKLVVGLRTDEGIMYLEKKVLMSAFTGISKELFDFYEHFSSICYRYNNTDVTVAQPTISFEENIVVVSYFPMYFSSK